MTSCSHSELFPPQFIASSLKLTSTKIRARVISRFKKSGVSREPHVREFIDRIASGIRAVAFDEHGLPVAQHLDFFND